MFDLEKSITEWRKQMLAAGIKTPVPMEELESHLRDEIEAQTKTGANEGEAFKAAVHEIGKAYALQREFNKVDTGHRILRMIGLAFGWMAASCGLIYAVDIQLNFGWNFFNYQPEWNLTTMFSIIEIAALVFVFWFLAKASRDRASRLISLFLCLCLAWIAFQHLPPEPNSKTVIHDSSSDPKTVARLEDAMSRHAPSPLWYRCSLTFFYCVPGILWISSELRRARDHAKPLKLQ